MRDREDPLLTLGRRRCDPTGLIEQRMHQSAQVDVERRQLDAQIVPKASERRSGTP
jgi:hypothetical protein